MIFCTRWIQCCVTYFIFTAVGGFLVLTPPSLVVEYGGPASAVCSTNMTIQSMAWEASQGAVDITPGAQQLTWNVSSLTHWDIKPLCFVNKDIQGNQERQYLPVIVYKKPDNVSISLVNTTGPVVEGGSYQLKCDIQNVTPVHSVIVNWYKGRTLVKTDNEPSRETVKAPGNKNVSLLISPNRADDGAQYSCEAVLDLGAEGLHPPQRRSSGPVSIPVHYSPRFSSNVEFIEQNCQQVTLNCTVTANPPPKYTWKSPQLKSEPVNPVLTLPHPSSGNYTCKAWNAHGYEYKLFIITNSPDSVGGVLVLTPPRLVVEYGGPASAVCSTNMTIQSMAWEASQGSVDITPRAQQLTWNVSSLTHWDIKPLCFVIKDIQGTQERQYLPVIVYKYPDNVSISLVNHTGPVVEWGSYQLKCDIQNVAPVHSVKVHWYRGGTLVKIYNQPSRETVKEPQNTNDSLLINPNRADDGVQYSCEAVLNLGAEGFHPFQRRSLSGPLRIPVHYKPLFPHHQETVVDTGDAFTLNCTVRANPPARYSWTSAHLRHAESSAVITLHSSGLGNYTCTASNKYGSDRKVFTVTKKPGRVVFWSILGTGLGVALALVAGYGAYVLFIKEKSPSNSVI
ncbi:vascular cell adhesion protein 1-like [Brachyhypopomus gauderio]|uniref:vascular cell adhesion protein 1-like n=1 Tax=Brachyhypopomus gauderio TaxID=698409 RepID=UPI00404378F7